MFKMICILSWMIFPIISSADDFLDTKVVRFQKAQSSQEKTEISSELFFIADNALKTGDSGKALLYFKTALALTPEYNSFITPKIESSLNVFMEYTLNISGENCSEIKKRNAFLQRVSPDSALTVLQKFPKCLSEKAESKIAVNGKEDFKKPQDIPLKVEIPRNNAKSEKQIFENFGEELAHIQRMNTYLPIDLIRALQMEGLKLIKFKAKKPELIAKSINDSTSMLKIPFSFDVTYPEPFTRDLHDRYKSLLSYKGQINIPTPFGPSISLSNVVESYFRKRRFNNSIQLPVFPSVIVFKATLQFKDRTETVLLPAIPEIHNKNTETLFFPTISKDELIRYMPDVKLTREAFESHIGLRLSNSTIKELKNISVEIDKEATFEFDKAINRYAKAGGFNPQDIGYEYTYYTDDSGSMSGVTLQNKKEGLYYISEEGKKERKAIFQSDIEIQSTDRGQTELAGTYCKEPYLCDSFVDLFADNNSYSITTSLKCSSSQFPQVWSTKLTKTSPTLLTGVLPNNKTVSVVVNPGSGLQSKLILKSDTADCPELKSGLSLQKSFEIDKPNSASPKKETPCFFIDQYFTCNENESISNNADIKQSFQKVDKLCEGNGHQKPCVLHGIYQYYQGNAYEAEMLFNSGCTGFKGKNSTSCVNLSILYSAQGKQHLASRYMMKACDMKEPIGCYTLGQYYKTFDDPERASYFFNKTCEFLTGHKTCLDEVATFAIKKKYKGKGI